MEQYYIASLAKNNEELEIKAVSPISQQEYIELFESFSFTGFYEICRSIKNMTFRECT